MDIPLAEILTPGRAITVEGDGTVHEDEPPHWAGTAILPELFGDGLDDLYDDWELLAGMSTREGSTSPVFAASEFIGGDLERYILDTPGQWLCLPFVEPDEFGGTDPTGWVLAHRYLT